MSLTKRFRPGSALDADEVEQNFTDLDSLISNLLPLQIEDGGIHTRNIETAAEWKTQETKTEAGVVVLGADAVIVPASASTFVTYANHAFLVRAIVKADATGVTPKVTLSIKIGASAVVSRSWEFTANGIIHPRIAWVAVASAATTTVELWASGTNVSVSLADLTVMAVQR